MNFAGVQLLIVEITSNWDKVQPTKESSVIRCKNLNHAQAEEKIAENAYTCRNLSLMIIDLAVQFPYILTHIGSASMIERALNFNVIKSRF